MKSFNYIIQSSEGIHARPATLIVNASKEFSSQISITNKDKIVDGKRMIAVMSLNAKKGDEVIVNINGEDEEKAFEKILNLFKENI